METSYQSFAAALRELLPAGARAAEITVPGRATRLLVVDHGEERGQTLIDLTETTRRMEDIAGMTGNDFDHMGAHPDDLPSVTTLSFVVAHLAGATEALPFARIDHLAEADPSLSGQILTGLAAGNFARYRRMGFFGPKALKTIPVELPADPALFHARIVSEHRAQTEMAQHKERQVAKRMAFLEECERERQHQERS